MFGLGLVFRRLGKKIWPAYLPAYNYIVLIRLLGLPKSWQAVAFVPYLGQVYSIPIAIRLGKIFHKSAAFSSLWLTVGAPVGMLVIAFTKTPLNLDAINDPAPRVDVEKIKVLTKKHKAR